MCAVQNSSQCVIVMPKIPAINALLSIRLLPSAVGSITAHGQYDDMFKALLQQPGDTWHSFWVVNGEFPTTQQEEQVGGS